MSHYIKNLNIRSLYILSEEVAVGYYSDNSTKVIFKYDMKDGVSSTDQGKNLGEVT